MNKRVTGLGGVFFKVKDRQKMNDWYAKHLGMDVTEYGANFAWREAEDKEKMGLTVWSTFKDSTDYFNPSTKDYMFNYRVENLVELMEQLKQEGVQEVGEIQVYSYGKFGWILDPEGNKIELWEPIEETEK